MSEKKLSSQEKAAITRDLFERYRRGETSQAENEAVESLESMLIPEKEFEITDELIDKLEAETTDYVFRKINKPRKRTLTPLFVGVAASVALLVIGLFLFQKPDALKDFEKQYVAIDTVKNIVLSDGSEITLNSGTMLREKSREVWLDKGEVFFDVKPDEKPFIVHLRNGLTVQVLGTSFTIQSYTELPFQKVSVLSGKVSVSTQNNQSVKLAANQQATYDTTKKELLKESTNSVQKAMWRTGAIVLENAAADELCLRMRQLYHKSIVFENQPETMSINITLDKAMPISEIADEIAVLYNFTYQITDDKIVFQFQDGTKHQ